MENAPYLCGLAHGAIGAIMASKNLGKTIENPFHWPTGYIINVDHYVIPI